MVEVGQDVAGPAFQCRAELAELGQGGRNAPADRVDDLLNGLPAGGTVGVAVGVDDPLVDAPGGLDCGVLVGLEQGLDPGLLLVGEQVQAGRGTRRTSRCWLMLLAGR